MSQTPSKSILRRWAPLVAVILGAVAGAVFLRDYLSFDTLRDNRDALLAYRDASPVLTPALFVLAYVVIVSFSLPGATVATLAGGVFGGALAECSNRLQSLGAFRLRREGFILRPILQVAY